MLPMDKEKVLFLWILCLVEALNNVSLTAFIVHSHFMILMLKMLELFVLMVTKVRASLKYYKICILCIY